MGSLSNYGERLALDVASGNKTTLTGVSQARYVALYTGGTPEEDGTLPQNVTEVSGGGYERTLVTFAAAEIAASGDNAGKAVAVNASPGVTFTTASSSWGTITAMAIWDAQTDGNMVWVGELTAQKIVDENDQLIFSAGNITLSMD